jgi:predicted O-methyltransferase YrrM
MLNRKISKVSHFLRSKVFQHKTVKSLSRLGGYGAPIAQAFLTTLKKKHTPEEDQLFKMLGEFRQDLSVNNQKISFKEIGSDTEMTVAEVSRRAASPEVWTRFFYQLSKTKSVNNILEIGTNLGVSGQYFIKALEGKKNTKFTSLEGVKGLCEIATERFKVLSDINRFEVLHGLYDQTFIKIVDRDDRFDLVFIDGNHQYESTLKYFELLKNNLSDQALIIFDDINWSEGMTKAWREICAQKGIVFSINLFKLGLIVFDANQTEISKNHYQLFLSV